MTQGQRFNIGDRVRVAKDIFGPDIGTEGVVVGVAWQDGDYEVQFSGWSKGHGGSGDLNNCDRWFVTGGQIELVAPAATSFKVGDRVRAPNSGPHWVDTTVTRVTPDATWSIQVVNKAGDYGVFDPVELELIAPEVAVAPAANPACFKIGDRVYVEGESDIGTITGENDGRFRVAWQSDVAWCASELHHHKPAALPLKQGARVRITGGIAGGLNGTVKCMKPHSIYIYTDDHYTDRAGQLMRHVSVNKANVRVVEAA